MRFIVQQSLACVLLLSLAPDALGHSLGESYVFVNIYEKHIEGRFELPLSDLDKALGLDRDNDGRVSQQEFEAGIAKAQEYVRSRFELGEGETAYPLRFTTHEIVSVPLGQYARLHFQVEGIGHLPAVIRVRNAIFFDTDPQHRGFLIIEYNDRTGVVNESEAAALIFSPGHERHSLDLTVKPSRMKELVAFVGHGIWHIWIGIDHILFLVALILPTALCLNSNRQWEPVSSFRPALMRVVKIVTLFTVAHSITLGLAAVGVVRLPTRLVETIIAASVLMAAANNIYPFFKDWGWTIIFAFGLFHGLGFASVLSHLVVGQGALLSTLLGFNVGVEIGQIGIVLAIFPMLYLLRQARAYPAIALKAGSGVIASIAFVWCIERMFDIEPMWGIL